MKNPTECRACSSTDFKAGPTPQFKACQHCGGLAGKGTAKQIAQVITLEFAKAEVEAEALTFFDVEITSGNATSCHGWFDPSTKFVHQFG